MVAPAMSGRMAISVAGAMMVRVQSQKGNGSIFVAQSKVKWFKSEHSGSGG